MADNLQNNRSGEPTVIDPSTATIDMAVVVPSASVKSNESTGLLFAPDDSRYRRPLPVRWLRSIGQWCWLVVVAYPITGVFNLLGLVDNGAPFAWQTVGQAFYVDHIIPMIASRPVIVLSPGAGFILLVVIAHICFADHQRERAEMKRRAERDRARQAQDQVLAQAGQAAAVAAEAAAVATVEGIGNAAVQPVIEAATAAGQAAGEAASRVIVEAVGTLMPGERVSEDLQGPPFDEALLPVPDRFVGRAAEVTWLVQRLSAGSAGRIAAVNGMGGIGKTTLAGWAVRQLRTDGYFKDGIAVVVCRDQHDAVEMLRRAISRLHPYRRQPTTRDLTELTEAARLLLASKDVLVVLDNVEPGFPLADVVMPLRSAGAAVLITARAQVGHSVIPNGARLVLGLLSFEEAIDLFAQAYGRADANDLNAAEYSAVRRIVTALDRHTLAVKLAGAHALDVTRDLDRLASELEDPRRAIALADGDVPAAVALAFTQSTRALSDDARRLFEGLAVFSATEFGRNAALALAKALGVNEPEASVNTLVVRALVDAVIDESLSSETDRERLRLHPLLRAFALKAFGNWSEQERDQAFGGIAQYYDDYTRAADLRAVSADESNMTAALAWALDHDEDELVMGLVMPLNDCWATFGLVTAALLYLPRCIATAEGIAARTQDASDFYLWVMLSTNHAQMLLYSGKIDEAEREAQHALEIARGQEFDLPRSQSLALIALTLVAIHSGRFSEADRFAHQALALATEVEDEFTSTLYALLGVAAQGMGKTSEAIDYFRRGQSIGDRPDGDSVGTTSNPENAEIDCLIRGRAAMLAGQFEEAHSCAESGLTLARDSKNNYMEGIFLLQRASVAWRLGQNDAAQQDATEALAISRHIANRTMEAEVLLLLGELALARNDVDVAQKHFSECLSVSSSSNFEAASNALSRLADIAAEQGHLDEAQNHLQQLLALCRDTAMVRDVGVIHARLGTVARSMGQMETAETYFVQAAHDILLSDLTALLGNLGNCGRPEGEPGRDEVEPVSRSEPTEQTPEMQSPPKVIVPSGEDGQLANWRMVGQQCLEDLALDHATDDSQDANEVSTASRSDTPSGHGNIAGTAAHVVTPRHDSFTARQLDQVRPIVERINGLEDEMRALDDDELRAMTGEFKQQLENGASLDDILPDAYAAVRETSRRVLGMRHFDVQLMGGIVLHQGKIAEMKMGEGKTLVAMLPSYLNALTGKGVHVVTVNDYLAKRDADWMGRIYRFLGLSVGTVLSSQAPQSLERKAAYAADITYAVHRDLCFDYLRDHVVADLLYCVQRDLNFAIVDEVDSILIDDATNRYQLASQDKVIGVIALQNYFRLYKKLAGMTCTALTEAEELHKIYELDVITIPTNMPIIREDHPDLIFRTQEGKFQALVDEIAERHAEGQPVLVGTTSVENSEHLSSLLERQGIPHNVLNAKQDAREAVIVAHAGRSGAVTIATNMAGRGTDIVLGGNPEGFADEILRERDIDPEFATEEDHAEALNEAKRRYDVDREKVVAVGGLCVIGTDRQESRRIDNQLRERSGRQGDPGESRFFISLESLILRIGAAWPMLKAHPAPIVSDIPIMDGHVSELFLAAQIAEEGRTAEQRLRTVEFDNILATHRNAIYGYRERVLHKESFREDIMRMMEREVNRVVEAHTTANLPDKWDVNGLRKQFETWMVQVPDDVFAERQDHMKRDTLARGLFEATAAAYADKEAAVVKAATEHKAYEPGAFYMRQFERAVILQVIDKAWQDYIERLDDELKGATTVSAGRGNDPLDIGRREAARAFEKLKQNIDHDVTELVLRSPVQIQVSESPMRQSQQESTHR